MGLRTRATLRTAGAAGRRIGWNAQWSDVTRVAAAAALASGHFAPWSIQARSVATSVAVSGGPFGGIFRSGSRPATANSSGLWAASPGLIATPELPPARADGR